MLIKDSYTPLSWRLGRVIELLPGQDNVVRLVRLLTGQVTVVRPVVKLVRLLVELDVITFISINFKGNNSNNARV